jgi:hypothetical protein
MILFRFNRLLFFGLFLLFFQFFVFDGELGFVGFRLPFGLFLVRHEIDSFVETL